MAGDNHFTITKADRDKRQYLHLLLIGDESESMINRYIDHGDLYIGLVNCEPMAVCVALSHDADTIEVKNLAVLPAFRRQGYGRRMLEHIERLYPSRLITLGTGETPSTLRFYKSCGYSYSHRIPDFFTDNYPGPIIEEGVVLRDMIYLKKDNRPLPFDMANQSRRSGLP